MSRGGAARFVLTALTGLAIGFGAGLWFAPRFRPPAPPIQVPQPQRAQPEALYAPIALADLPGWTEDRLTEAFPALRASCTAFAHLKPEQTVGRGGAARPARRWQEACSALTAGADADEGTLRTLLDAHFEAFALRSVAGDDPGRFTGYYETELAASPAADARYRVPVYGLPRDLVAVDLDRFLPVVPPGVPRQIVGRLEAAHDRQNLVPYFTRAQIDADHAIAAAADVLLWADDPVAVHILHIQGSGLVTLPDGTHRRLAFAGHNGQRFTGIGAILRDAGVLKPGETDMEHVRAWLESHPAEAMRYMNENARYIFFRLLPANAPGPIGALGVALAPGRSLAVDPTVVPLGAPVWLDTRDPDGKPLTRLMLAQDTGAAITGVVRGDFFWGTGSAAFAKAARMNSPGRYYVLLPRG